MNSSWCEPWAVNEERVTECIVEWIWRLAETVRVKSNLGLDRNLSRLIIDILITVLPLHTWTIKVIYALHEFQTNGRTMIVLFGSRFEFEPLPDLFQHSIWQEICDSQVPNACIYSHIHTYIGLHNIIIFCHSSIFNFSPIHSLIINYSLFTHPFSFYETIKRTVCLMNQNSFVFLDTVVTNSSCMATGREIGTHIEILKRWVLLLFRLFISLLFICLYICFLLVYSLLNLTFYLLTNH